MPRDDGNQPVTTIAELLTSARAGIDRLTPVQALDEVRRGAALVDIRPSEQRRRDGDPPGARIVPRNVLEWRLDPRSQHRDPELAHPGRRVILLCDEGYQSSLAAATLRRFGIDATDVIGGMQGWLRDGLPVEGSSGAHWQRAYQRGPDELSWTEARPETSLALIGEAKLPPETAILDVGGGTSRLAAELLAAGFADVTVADVAAAALARARAELGAEAARVAWIEADVRDHDFGRRFDLWHDRALLHFMVGEEDRDAYLRALDRGLAPGGQLVLATFAPDGPDRCSGLPVRRYDAEGLAELLGDEYELLSSRRHEHRTPSGKAQPFTYAHLRRNARP